MKFEYFFIIFNKQFTKSKKIVVLTSTAFVYTLLQMLKIMRMPQTPYCYRKNEKLLILIKKYDNILYIFRKLRRRQYK